jgi:hypothetical protein
MGMIPHHDAYIFINDDLVVLLYLVLIFFCEWYSDYLYIIRCKGKNEEKNKRKRTFFCEND